MRGYVLLLLLVSVSVSAQTIAEYPNLFFEGREFTADIIKGDLRTVEEITAANLIVNKVPELYRPIFRAGGGFNFYRIRANPESINRRVFVASEVSELTSSSILVGTPCTNEWVRNVLEIKNCNVFPANHGYIIMGSHDGIPVLVITGGSPEMVLKASDWLHSEGHFRFNGRVARLRENGFSVGYAGYPIGYPGDMLQIGQPIGQVTPVVTVGQYRSVGVGSYGSYLRFGNGRVVFGEGS